jgi:hypothetical protein
MDASTDTLPWSALRLSEPNIPWDDLRTLADAAVQSGEVRGRLMGELDCLLDGQAEDDEGSFQNPADLAIPAVFALAADRFDNDGRREVAEFLIHSLYRAGEVDNEFLLEVVEQAAGRLGSALVEPAIKLIESKGQDSDCWFHLFGLLEVAADADSPTKQAVIDLCRRVIRKAPDRYEGFSSANPAASVLALLGDVGSLPMLRSVHAVSHNADFWEAIERLEGKGDPSLWRLPHPWDTPVEEWLPERVKELRAWIEEREADEEFPDDEDDEPESAYERYSGLVDEFWASDACRALPEAVRKHAEFMVGVFLEYMWDYKGVSLERLRPTRVSDILLDYFPRKITADSDFYESAPAVLTVFFRWLGQTGRVADAESLCDKVNDVAKEMLACSQDPLNWGPAKSLFMQAKSEGVDVTDDKAMKRYTALYGLRQLAAAKQRREAEPRGASSCEYLPAPIVRQSPKVRRNDPCTCGSGKKYKKCCGRVIS